MFVEHLKGWVVAITTQSTTAEFVMEFFREELIHCSGPLSKIVIDNDSCFTTKSLGDFMGKREISWRTVME